MKILRRAILSLLILLGLASGILQWTSALQFSQGKNFYENKDFYQALTSFQNAKSFFSRNPEIHRWLAKSYLQLVPNRNPQSQLELLRKAEAEALLALGLEKEYPYYWSLLGQISELMEHLGAKPKKDSFSCHHQALILDPNNPIFLFFFSRQLIKNGKPEQAKVLLPKLVKTDMTSALEFAQLWLEQKNAPEELIPFFAPNPQSAERLRDLLHHFGFFSAEIELGAKTLELAPDDPSARLVYGSALSANNECAKLEQVLEPMLSHPDYEEKVRWIYANCFGRTKNYDRAEKEYLRLISLQPGAIEYRFNLAHLYLATNQPELAQAHLLWLVNHPKLENARKAPLLLKLGELSEKKNQLPEAFKFYQLYFNLNPNDERIKQKLIRLKAYQTNETIYSPWEKEDEKE